MPWGFPQGAEVLIPILLLRDQSTSGNTELRGDLFRHPFAALISRIVVVQTERHHLRSFHPRQNPPYRFIAGTAAGHIAVLLPVLRMQGDIGEKVDRGLKYIQVPIISQMVKAVSRVTARHVEFEGLALTVGAALLRVTGNAVFVCVLMAFFSYKRHPKDSIFFKSIFCGLIFCLFGDILITMSYIPVFFLLGIICFFICHLLFINGFCRKVPFNHKDILLFFM